jgi:soluble P-type ATPase
MISLTIPGFADLQLKYLVSDYNGTLAVDGVLLPGLRELIPQISRDLQIHAITADTFGCAAKELQDLPVQLTITPPDSQAEAKRDFVARLGEQYVVAIGNGRNDRLMLKAAALGIVVIQQEGSATETIREADVVARNIIEALELLRHSQRLVATLRT